MMDELEDLHMIRLRALENTEKNKMRVAKYYNKKVKVKQFAEGDLVWKALLPIGTKYSTFGKWSPNWEGPFRVVRCTPGNAYILKSLLGLGACSCVATGIQLSIRQHTKHTIKISQLKASHPKNDLKLSAQFDMLIW
jgi:hypothetical protein